MESKAGAIFDVQKLDWINSQYIKKMSVDELHNQTKKYFEEKDFYKSWSVEHGAWNEKNKEDYLKKVLAIEQERLQNLSGVGESNKFFFEHIEYDKDLLRWKEIKDEEIKNNLSRARELLENITTDKWTRENIGNELLTAAGNKRGEFLWPLRATLTGEKKSPPPGEVAWVLGKEESLARINRGIELLN
jgi:nondiscriminating glutamyl-tRNA synthetase